MQGRQIRCQCCVQGLVVPVGNASVLPDYYAMPWGSGGQLASLCHEGWHGGSSVGWFPCPACCHVAGDFPHHLSPLLSSRLRKTLGSTRTGSLCHPLAHGDSACHGVSHCMEFLAKLFCGWAYDKTNTAVGFSDGVPSLDLWAEGCTHFPPHPPLWPPPSSLVTGSMVFASAFPPAPGHREWKIFFETAFPLHTAVCPLETYDLLWSIFLFPWRGRVTCRIAHTSSVIFPFFNIACVSWACRHFPMSKLLPHAPNTFSACA